MLLPFFSVKSQILAQIRESRGIIKLLHFSVYEGDSVKSSSQVPLRKAFWEQLAL